MRTANECRTKVRSMERKAARCGIPALEAEYLELAACWAHLAGMATWQDAHASGDVAGFGSRT